MRRHIISTKEDREWQGIPAIERAANGRLWSAFFTGGPREPDPENYIILSTSEDDGVTWTKPVPIVVPEGKTRAYDPALWHDPKGRLWLIYNITNVEEKNFSVWVRTTEDSTVANPVWSEPRKIELNVPFAYRLNKPIVIANGDWILPVTWARNAPDWDFAGDDQISGVAISSDEGETWSFHGEVWSPPESSENMMVELQDGRLWMLIRTGDGVLWQCFSSDNGRTWSEASATEFVNPCVRFYIRRLQSGRLLLINTPNPTQRQGMKAYLSDPEDDFKFGPGMELDERDQVSYPDAIQAPDGTIYMVHDCDRQNLGEIILDVFTEEDILAIQPG